jgi:hypothetical protein
MRKINVLSLFFIDFYVPVLTPRLGTDRTENTSTLLQFTGRCLVMDVVYLFVSLSLPRNGSQFHNILYYGLLSHDII